MSKRTKKERANKEWMKSARKIVRGLTPEECKWWLLNRVFWDKFPDVYSEASDRLIAAWGQECMYDQLLGDHG